MPSVSLNDYITLPKPEIPWIWRGILPAGGSTLVYGDPKIGKSFLILKLAEAVASKTIDSYLGLDIMTRGPVLYIQLDTPRSLWASGYIPVVAEPTARDNIFILDKEMPDVPKMFDIRLSSCQDWLRREVDMRCPTFVIIDTIRRMHKGDENDSTVMSQVLDSFQHACHPAALALLSHKRKQQHGEMGDGVARGSSALMGAVDSLVNMRKDKLLIEARSDVAEEIPIYQKYDGTFSLNSRQDDIQIFIADLGEMPATVADKRIAEEFKVSTRTARSWRSGYIKDTKR